MKNKYTIDIQAPLECVFHWIDDAERVKEWLPNVVENEDLNVTDDRIGSTFRQVYVENGKRMEMHGVVTGFVPNRQMKCEVTGDSFDLNLDYQLEEIAGGTRLIQDSEVRFKGFLKLLSPILTVISKLAPDKSQDESMGKLKALAEADAKKMVTA